MSFLRLSRLLAVALLLVCFVGVSEAGGVYLGPRSGMMMIDVQDVDDIVPVGGVIGYAAPSGISAEIEFNYGVAGGDWIPTPGVSADFNIWTLAGYGAYRLSLGGGAYLKGKVGILRETVDAEVTAPPIGRIDISAEDTGLSLGAGAGFNFTDRVMAEAEVTLIEADVIFLSLGVNFSL